MKSIKLLKLLLVIVPVSVFGGFEESQDMVLEARQYDLSSKATDAMYCQLIEKINLNKKDNFGALCYIYNIAKRNAYLNTFKSVQIKAKNVSLDILEAYLLQYCKVADQNALIFILDRDILEKYQNEFTLALSTYHTKIKNMQDRDNRRVRTKIFNQLTKQYKKICSKNLP